MLSILLWMKNTCPFLDISYCIASLIISSLNCTISVSIAILFGGGVLITDKSLAPSNENCKVRGIGVADKVRISTFSLKFFSLSFMFTPNFCSSSTINNPKSLKFISLPTIR